MYLLGNAVQLYRDLIAAQSSQVAYVAIKHHMQTIKRGDVSLLSGLAGLGYCIVCARQQFAPEIAVRSEEWLEQIDKVVLAHARNCLNAKHYDYFTGFFGGLFYLLSRVNNDAVRYQVEQLLQQLDGSTTTVGGVRVIGSAENVTSRTYEFGVAHGQAGYLAVLSHAINAGIGGSRVKDIFFDLWDTLHIYRGVNGQFPDVLERDYCHYVPFRWCRGAFGIMASLYFAQRRVGNEARGRALLLELGTPNEFANYLDEYVVDHTFCHGTQGFLAITARLYRASNLQNVQQLHAVGGQALQRRVLPRPVDYSAQAQGILQGDLSAIPNALDWATITLL